MINFDKLDNVENKNDEEISTYILNLIKQHVPNSSTRLSLRIEGYPEDGYIESTIREYQKNFSGLETGYHALLTGCGNCQDMSYAAALLARAAGYKGELSIGQFGINHRFLFLGNQIIDPWAEMHYNKNDWRDHLNAYGGSIKEGIMKGRTLPSTHEELEDDIPEMVEKIPVNVEFIFKKYHKTGAIGEQVMNEKQSNLEEPTIDNNTKKWF